jgi:diacylglycerol kinase (ATP)
MEDNIKTNSNLLNQNNLDILDLTTKYVLDNIKNTIVLFCNPLSGNREGEIILDIASNYKTQENYKLIDFQYLNSKKAYEPIKVVVFELINKEDNEKGQVLLRHCYEKCKQNFEKGLPEEYQKVRTLIGGGDGTVLSMIESFIKNGTDINYCIFGHIPLGTGNDLANTLGFSDHINISKNNLDHLYKILYRYYKANFGKIDIWKMDLVLDSQEGEILVNTKKGKKPLTDSNNNIIKRYVRSFINYVSLGYDARVGYNFDPKRTHSRNGNKCIYFCEGFKKLTCRKTVSIQGFIDTFTIYDSLDNSYNQESFFSDIESGDNNVNPSPAKDKIKFQFMSKKTYAKEKNIEKQNNINKKHLVVEGEPCSIIFQNIVNYMSGVNDMWGKGKEQLAISVKDANKEVKKKYTEKLKKMADEKQRFDDKKLEVFTFDNGFKTGFEKVIGGFAKKIYHGRGPMEIKFLETPKFLENDKKHRIYLNLDGEYFHIVKPISMRLELNRDLCQGQLPFLIGNLQ